MAGCQDSTLQWRHNERDCVSNHRRLHSLLNRLFGSRSKKTSKLRATGICEGNPPVVSPHKGLVKLFHLTASWNPSIAAGWHGSFQESQPRYFLTDMPVTPDVYDHLLNIRQWLKNSTRMSCLTDIKKCFLIDDSDVFWTHDDVIKWKHFPRNWPFVRGIHRSRWIPRTKASDAEFWCLLWSASE